MAELMLSGIRTSETLDILCYEGIIML